MRVKAKLISHKRDFCLFEGFFDPNLKDGEFYSVDIKPYKTSRSLAQNNLLWELITQLAEKTGNDTMDIYISALEHCNAKYEYIGALAQAEDDLKRVFRAVKPQGTFTTAEGKELVRYKCYIGSSKYNTAEMNMLIDYIEGELYV